MDRSLNIRLGQGELDELRALAELELRDTRAQAAYLIRVGLRRANSEQGRADRPAARAAGR